MNLRLPTSFSILKIKCHFTLRAQVSYVFSISMNKVTYEPTNFFFQPNPILQFLA
uniref:Uncharacterized protein n=1 Tax=Anguilla anguilla TaxID=7936 RepID=A0A0E9UYY2_ANGAN